MTTTKVVIRLLDRDGTMLGWVAHEAAVRGDGCLRASHAVDIPIDVTGHPTEVSLHWADVNVETRVAATVASVKAGNRVRVFPANATMVVVGTMPGPLPAVTVRQPVAIGVPAGSLGSSG